MSPTAWASLHILSPERGTRCAEDPPCSSTSRFAAPPQLPALLQHLAFPWAHQPSYEHCGIWEPADLTVLNLIILFPTIPSLFLLPPLCVYRQWRALSLTAIPHNTTAFQDNLHMSHMGFSCKSPQKQGQNPSFIAPESQPDHRRRHQLKKMQIPL